MKGQWNKCHKCQRSRARATWKPHRDTSKSAGWLPAADLMSRGSWVAVGTGREGRAHPDRCRAHRTSSSLGPLSRTAQTQELAWTPVTTHATGPIFLCGIISFIRPLFLSTSELFLAWSSGSPLQGSTGLWPRSTHKAESTIVRPLRGGRFSCGGGTAT